MKQRAPRWDPGQHAKHLRDEAPDWFRKRVNAKRNEWARMPRARKDKLFVRLLKEQNGRCKLCNDVIDQPALANLDHLRPLGRGGNNSKQNLAAAHITCNQAKGLMTFEEWRSRITT